MAEIKVSDRELMTGFLDVFRKLGYEGASLEELSRASGLKKSSLYHRYPGGKKQMAQEVLEYVGTWVGQNVIGVLNGKGDPKVRLKKVMGNLDYYYAGGKNYCLLRSLSTASGLLHFEDLIQRSFILLIIGFSNLIKDLGFPSEKSIAMAEDIVVKIQGSLIVSKGTKNLEIFKRTLVDIEKSLNT